MAKRRAPAGQPGDDGYDQHRESARRRQAGISRSTRDIGPIPKIGNIRRRDKARGSLKLFCETYNPEAFRLGWSQDHLTAIARIEEAATTGALYAYAMARGSGKTTIARMATLWAIGYNYCRYVFLIGANAEKAADSLSAIKTYIRFLPLIAEDFPELSLAVQALAGIANRASGQLCQGEPTLIEWGKDRIILPTVPPPANWPKRWKLRDDGMTPTSGAVISASGLTGDGIRGSLLTLSTGEAIRPDLVLLDDPQTNESARSPSQNDTRLQLVLSDVLGMAGPDKAIAAVMPCTIIEAGDFVDQILDRTKHPLWRGERTGILKSMPANMAAWDEYFEVYRACALKEPPDYAEANALYIGRRAVLDQGAVASWDDRKLPWEVSAIQHAMHLYARDRRAFWAEYMNAPLRDEAEDQQLNADVLMERVNRHERGVPPAGSTRLTAFVDVQGSLLFWVVCAWDDAFGGAIIDYGTHPRQQRLYFTLRDAEPTLATIYPGRGLEAQLYAGLEALCTELVTRNWKHDAGMPILIDRLLIDANWGQSTEVVKQYCRQSPFGATIMPSHGRYIGASSSPLTDRAKKLGERFGLNWMVPLPRAGAVRHITYDTNWWKTFVAARLTAGIGDPGALTLFGDRPETHRLLADHLTAEFFVRTTRVKDEAGGREVEEWKLKPNRDNHWWDCLVGCAVGASERGTRLGELPAAGAPQPKPAMSFSEMQAKKMREFRQRGGHLP